MSSTYHWFVRISFLLLVSVIVLWEGMPWA
jgi:hypothetical protein